MTDISDTAAQGTPIKVYTTVPCAYCTQAKALLDARGYDYEEIDMAGDPDGREELVAMTGRMTFPQIVVRGRSIGGFQELLAAHRAGTLAQVLEEEAA
jgi:glutaredoxin 3